MPTPNPSMTTSGDAPSTAQTNINGPGVGVTKIPQETKKEFSPPERAILAQWVDAFRTSDKDSRTNMMRKDVFLAFRKLNLVLSEEAWTLKKGQIKTWFQNNGRRSNTGIDVTLTKKVTLAEVIGQEYKSEVNALASEMAGGAKSGSKEAFGNYKKALKTFTDNLPDEAKAAAKVERKRWEAEGKPEEVKIRNVEKAGGKMFRATAEMQFREFGARSIVWEFHPSKSGAKLYTCHDYNGELGDITNLRPFEEKFPQEFQDFEMAFIKYMRYVEELQNGTIVEEPKRQSAKILIELEMDDAGYPVLPAAGSDPTKDRLEYQKRLIRSFLTHHYRFACGRPGEKFPWQLFASKRLEFVDKKFLPAGSELRDPSDMKKDEVDNHLSFWRTRQESEPTAGKVFRFKACCIGRTSSQLQPATYGSRPRSEGKKKQKKTRAGDKVATPTTQAGPQVPVLLSIDQLNSFGFPPDSNQLADGGQHNVVNINMQGALGEEPDNDRIPPCGLSLPADMQPGYSGHDENFPTLDVELDPELACLLPQTDNLNPSSLYPGEYNIHNNAFNHGITRISGINNQASLQEGLAMLPEVIVGSDHTKGTYVSQVSAGWEGLHALSLHHQTNLSMQSGGQHCSIDMPPATDVQRHSVGLQPIMSGSKRKAGVELAGQPVQKRRGRSANHRKVDTAEETNAAAVALGLESTSNDDGILTTGGPNREKRVSARVAKKAADEVAKLAAAEKATGSKGKKRSGRR